MGPLIASLAISTLIGWAIGASKGRSVEGFFLGLILPGIGWILAAIMKPTIAIQAQRDVALEQAREQLRQEALEQARAELRAEQQGAGQPLAPAEQPPADPWDTSNIRRR